MQITIVNTVLLSLTVCYQTSNSSSNNKKASAEEREIEIEGKRKNVELASFLQTYFFSSDFVPHFRCYYCYYYSIFVIIVVIAVTAASNDDGTRRKN